MNMKMIFFIKTSQYLRETRILPANPIVALFPVFQIISNASRDQMIYINYRF
jgi:hypothetical protein